MTQYARVKAVLEATKKPLALHEIGRISRRMHQVRDAETAISARIRDIRHDLESEGKTILSTPAARDKKYHKYWIANITH